jgi:hypothetical protein
MSADHIQYRDRGAWALWSGESMDDRGLPRVRVKARSVPAAKDGGHADR